MIGKKPERENSTGAKIETIQRECCARKQKMRMKWNTENIHYEEEEEDEINV